MIELTNFIEEMKSTLKTIKQYSEAGGDLEVLKQIKIAPFTLPSKPIDILAIDGSHAFILNFSAKWLVIIKIAALLYELVEGEKIGFKLKEAYLLEKPVIVAGQRDEQLNLANELLRNQEQMVLLTLASKLSNILIAVDGSLAMLKNRNIAIALKENENLLAGISKDSNTHFFGARMSDEELLSFHPHQSLGYVRAPIEGEGYLEVYFAKLFPSARRWFRVDIVGDAMEIFPQLACYSRSQLCPGYPYPLLEAHRFAVTVRHFKERYEEILFNLAASEGIELERIASWRTNLDGMRIDSFHEYLDEISRIRGFK